MKLEICTWPDDVLAARAEPVAEITPEMKKLINDMVETMYEGDGVGLAAPQVGESIRLICVDQTGPKLRADLRVLINPEIVECDGEVESEEGCLSCPEFSGTVMRKERVKVTGMDPDGGPVCIDTDGFLAIVLQHEIDHLNGITIADRAGRLKKAMYRKRAAKWKA
ncbi:MAG: peptide deformylase [Pseudodesulfovibrio sp.]|uniref:Peptide deformylase n=1 Tax=Pseudodesulfovibrio aespoeensis (strain ATCC 700646 / DSM 10631 / Aspo-2) TaxID=643562 RepID=E6VVQ9_PSEA9|nr:MULTISPECIES: peptide deformylase [Pseudodesulfovibrio]MBU4191200.1 peptide deformylase [Pseudomonadota bacterium]ADU61261.1 peptide deformylase [Pseudodesulfovibrio aespoeensis Aspo-2]MBU4245085.1 peptide deformylase [Pseudomonadota bacterium]MBU4379412.1 peptide deformylase [Pseudomonadota bacterium]MBU4474317.1 peptide deformylase [Pseudomonadota bacterium]